MYTIIYRQADLKKTYLRYRWITNVGAMAGEEIVLLYMRDDYASPVLLKSESLTRVALERVKQNRSVKCTKNNWLYGTDNRWVNRELYRHGRQSGDIRVAA